MHVRNAKDMIIIGEFGPAAVRRALRDRIRDVISGSGSTIKKVVLVGACAELKFKGPPTV